jgi:capsular polysaccharide biosynthesis protein
VVRFLRLRKRRFISFKNKLLLLINSESFSYEGVENYENLPSQLISGSVKIDFLAPRFFFSIKNLYLDSPLALTSREVRYRILENVVAIGRTEILNMENRIILPFGYSVQLDVLPIELDGEITFDIANKTAKLMNRKTTHSLDEAIHLLGSLTGNYAHWVLEYLPKFIAIAKLGIPPSVPILVDDWLHPRFIESIRFYLKDDRPLIMVPKYSRINVKKIHFLDNFSYVPPIDRKYMMTGNPPVPSANRYHFSTLGIDLIRSTSDLLPMGGNDVSNQKLFLLRTEKTSGNKRQITNMREIVDLAKEYGYFVIDPAELSFEEQRDLFRGARIVISPLGAAMVNLIFAPKGCKVIGLSPRFENGDYFYFAILNSFLSHDFSYLLGKPSSNDSNHNSNFTIELGEFKSVLDWFHLE